MRLDSRGFGDSRRLACRRFADTQWLQAARSAVGSAAKRSAAIFIAGASCGRRFFEGSRIKFEAEIGPKFRNPGDLTTMHDNNMVGKVPGSPLPALGDAQQAEHAGLAQRIANRGRANAGAIADFFHRSVAFAVLPAIGHDDVERRALAFGELAGEFGPDSLHAGKTPLAPPPHRIARAVRSLAAALLAAQPLRITGARQRAITHAVLLEARALPIGLFAKPLRVVLAQRFLAVERPYLTAKIVQLGQ
ncbi:MAG: hypothetical protein E5X33_29755 [Mesorhizobium sp.]|uniref:hypothetical protein n=1 Tax=Mesorhizobium sp. TaxID=1871066 RepID=UPI0012164A0E|nr:hypothetical protein [Mesorhizobium sp.]TIR16174.1 MAG: hypothetical protein E5X33_29755 [Mesorhizobium sp.]